MEDHMTNTCQWRLVYCTDCNEQFAKRDEDVSIKRFYVALNNFDSKRRLSSHSFQFCLVLSTRPRAFPMKMAGKCPGRRIILDAKSTHEKTMNVWC